MCSEFQITLLSCQKKPTTSATKIHELVRLCYDLPFFNLWTPKLAYLVGLYILELQLNLFAFYVFNQLLAQSNPRTSNMASQDY